MEQGDLRTALLDAVPDLPRNIEARGFLLRDETMLRGTFERPSGSWDGLIVSPTFHVAVALGRPSVEVIAETLDDRRAPWNLVADLEAVETIHPALADWSFTEARIGYRSETKPPQLGDQPAEAEIHPLERTRELLAHVPEDLRQELLELPADVPTVSTFVDGLPVAFCSAYPQTETLWDVAIDTLAPYRRRGLARATAVSLIATQLDQGKKPVWGALETNLASIRLAESLGFEWVARLGVWEAPHA